jgi:4-amino-4-deoxy-L-arabinose transferase-like glycosyltransferase
MVVTREAEAALLAGRAPTIAAAAAHVWKDEPRPRWQMVAIGLALVGLALFAVRLAEPPAFSGNEWRLSAYALDALENGRWFSQTDTLGEPAAKPPLMTWLVALAALPTSRVGVFALYWPSAAATAATACVLLRVGWTRFGWRAGLLTGLSYLVSNAAFDQMRTARYDAILALAVTLGAVAAERAWSTGRSWTWFWGAAAVGTLVKGPVAVALSASGLLTARWRDRSAAPIPPRGRHWPGLAIYLAIVGGWFVAAYLQGGPAMIDKLLYRELLGHAIGTEPSTKGWHPGGVYAQPLMLLAEYAPWSLLTAVAAWRVLRRPAEGAAERRFERFVLGWLVVDTLIFALAAHHRARLIHPVIPAAALLAGRELALWTRRLAAPALLRACAAVAIGGLAVLVVHGRVDGRAERARADTGAARALARVLEDAGRGEFPLTYVDGWKPLQVWRNTRRVITPLDAAAGLLRGEEAAFVVVGPSRDALDRALAGRPPAVLYRWPATGPAEVEIVSNHPRLEWAHRTATEIDGLRLQMEAVRLLRTTGDEMVFLVERGGGAVSVTNASSTARSVRLRAVGLAASDGVAERCLAPGASWQQRFPAWAPR